MPPKMESLHILLVLLEENINFLTVLSLLLPYMVNVGLGEVMVTMKILFQAYIFLCLL